jgi:SWIM zinc finger
MKLMIETTVFTDAKMPNHSYMLDDAGIAIGMRKFSAGEVVKFRTPIILDRRGRTFKLVDDLGPDTPVSNNIVEVAGSGSNVYTVDLDKKQCSCPGFSFRGDCKHIAIAEKESAK